MENNKTKTALVTGAASGLGYQLALLLAEDHYHLILIDINAEKLNKSKAAILEHHNTQITVLAKDLSTPNVAEVIYNSISNRPIDIVVNNAGFGLFGAFSDTNWERESQMLYLHIFTTTHLTKLILPDMKKRGTGKILNISSLAAFQPGPLMSIYYASKAYILSFSEAVSNELKGTSVTMTVLCPGPTKTGFQDIVSEGTSANKIAFNMACSKQVAAYGYKAMHKGKTVAIPGLFNKFLSILPRMVTRNRATKIVRQIQDRNRD